MRILVDILHPAHVHFFRHAIHIWEARGHEVCITLRDKDIARTLLDRLGLPYANLGAAGRGLVGMGIELWRRNRRLWRITRRFRPDVLAGIAGISIAHVGWLCRIPSVVFTDTENATLSNRLAFPFATVVCTPACYERPVRSRRHVTYQGYHELAYTAPRYFTPDRSRLRQWGVGDDERFMVMRLIAWGAAHDLSDRGFTDVAAAVRRLRAYGRVLISAEADLPAELAAYRIAASPEDVHHLLAFASLYIGESATMASESAALGTPAIFVSTSVRGYTNEQGRKYDLVYTFSERAGAQERALARAEAILAAPDAKRQWAAKRDRMLAESVDVTQFVVELVESCGSARRQRA
jgi:hypothetical protein